MPASRLNARALLWTLQYNIAGGNFSTSAWTQILAKQIAAASAVEIFNSGGSILQISSGTVGNEAASIIPYTILPGGSSILVPAEMNTNKVSIAGALIGFRAGLPLTCKAVDQASTSGYLIINAFG